MEESSNYNTLLLDRGDVKQCGVKAKEDERAELNRKMASTIRLLYTVSKVRIYKVADKIASSAVSREEKMFAKSNEIEIPVADSWNFELGDKVQIKYQLRDFKSIQTRTLGWTAKLRYMHGCIGIIRAFRSKFENALQVYFPARLATACLYAGVFDKVVTDKDDDPVTSRWEVGQYVRTKTDPNVVELLQRGLDHLPHKNLGRRGRIIAVTRVAVIVTFNERTSFHINSYLLDLHPDQISVKSDRKEHKGRHKVGDKVRMLSNFKKLVQTQKGKAEWVENMSHIIGKVVTIVYVKKDGTLFVQYKCGGSWRVSSESVIKLNEDQLCGRENDIQFVRRDIVKVKLVDNIRMLLESENVPMVFLEFLRNTAEVKLVDKNFDYLIRYNCDLNVLAYAGTLRQATDSEQERHKNIKDAVKTLDTGSEVYLDVGPPNFVNAVLKEVDAPRNVIRALTTKAKVVGFAEDNRAVIEYSDGSRYKVRKKFLTVPEKFYICDTVSGIELEVIEEIVEAVRSCAKNAGRELDGPIDVNILSMVYGSTAKLDLQVNLDSTTAPIIGEILPQVIKRDIEFCGDGLFFIKKTESHPYDIKVCLYFNSDEYEHPLTPGDVPPAIGGQGRLNVGDALPVVSGAETTEAGPKHSSEEDAIPMPGLVDFRAHDPSNQFCYLRLHDPTLGRDICFPYMVYGHRKESEPAEQGVSSASRLILNVTAENIKEVNIN